MDELEIAAALEAYARGTDVRRRGNPYVPAYNAARGAMDRGAMGLNRSILRRAALAAGVGVPALSSAWQYFRRRRQTDDLKYDQPEPQRRRMNPTSSKLKKTPRSVLQNASHPPTKRKKKSFSKMRRRLRRFRRRRPRRARKTLARVWRRAMLKKPLLYRFRTSTGSLLAAAENACGYHENVSFVKATFEDLFSKYRHATTAGVGTLDLLDGTGMDYSNIPIIVKLHQTHTYRNNYVVPCQLTFYKVFCRSNTDNGPFTHYTQRLDHFTQGDEGAEATINFYPSDVNRFTSDGPSKWYYKAVGQLILQPGQQKTIVHNVRWRRFNSNLFKSTVVGTWNYFSRISTGILARIQGVVGHAEASESNTGVMDAKCDVLVRKSYVFTFPESTQIPEWTVSNDLDTVLEIVNPEAPDVIENNPGNQKK